VFLENQDLLGTNITQFAAEFLEFFSRCNLLKAKTDQKNCPLHQKIKKTTSLLLDLCKDMYGTGKVVVLDSGFCVLEGLIALKKLGVFAHAVIKKRRYWPKYIPGDEIDTHMREKNW
jgi:hypothetical protein